MLEMALAHLDEFSTAMMVGVVLVNVRVAGPADAVSILPSVPVASDERQALVEVPPPEQVAAVLEVILHAANVLGQEEPA